MADGDNITDLQDRLKKQPDPELAKLVEAVEDIRAQLEARGQSDAKINQTIGACIAVYLLQRL